MFQITLASDEGWAVMGTGGSPEEALENAKHTAESVLAEVPWQPKPRMPERRDVFEFIRCLPPELQDVDGVSEVIDMFKDSDLNNLHTREAIVAELDRRRRRQSSN